MPDPVLSLSFSWHHWCPHFTDEETEPQEGNITCADRSWQRQVWKLDFLPPGFLFQALGGGGHGASVLPLLTLLVPTSPPLRPLEPSRGPLRPSRGQEVRSSAIFKGVIS